MQSKKRRLCDRLELVRFITVGLSVRAEAIEREGKGEEAALVRSRADYALKLQRKIADQIWG